MLSQSKLIITTELIDDFIFCPIKPLLILKNAQSNKSEYLKLDLKQRYEYKNAAKQKIAEMAHDVYSFQGKLAKECDLKKGHSLLLDIYISAEDVASNLHGLIKKKGSLSLGLSIMNRYYYQDMQELIKR